MKSIKLPPEHLVTVRALIKRFHQVAALKADSGTCLKVSKKQAADVLELENFLEDARKSWEKPLKHQPPPPMSEAAAIAALRYLCPECSGQHRTRPANLPCCPDCGTPIQKES